MASGECCVLEWLPKGVLIVGGAGLTLDLFGNHRERRSGWILDGKGVQGILYSCNTKGVEEPNSLLPLA